MAYSQDPKNQTPVPPYTSASPAPIGSPQPQYQNPQLQQPVDQNYQQYNQQPYQQPYQQSQELDRQFPSPPVGQTPLQSPPPVQQQESYHQPNPQAQMEQKHPHGPDAHMHTTKPGDWHHGMCDCFGDMGKCCLACWCPCITYGKIQHRLRNNDFSNYSACNGPCWGFCALMSCCGFQWIMSMMQRGEVRHRYNLDGSGFGDCARHWCCECCALIQEQRELETREALLAPNRTGYQQQGGMNYPGH